MEESQPINFACETIGMEELIMCSFQLKKSGYDVLMELLKGGKRDVDSLVTETGLERSTVQKSLQRLEDSDLVEKRQVNITTGGYKYLYSSADKGEIKKRVLGLIEDWVESARSVLGEW